MKEWLFLILAIVFEVCGTTSMKLSEGFKKITPSILIFIFYGISFVSITMALKKIDVSIAYAIWSGLGTLAVALIGMVYFKEPASFLKIISIILIILGVIGLNLSGSKH